MDAKQVGRQIYADSVLLPDTATEAELALAREVTENVLVADAELIRSEMGTSDGVVRGLCNFVVGFPISLPVAKLQAPILVLDGLGSGQNVGQ
eukprot:4409693-Amphidinium_carterae.1